MKISLSAIFLIISLTYSIAQKVSGVVFNEQGIPISSVNVMIVENGQSTYTDSQGEFNLTLSPGKYTFVFQFLGYEINKFPLEVKMDTLIQVKLSPKLEKIDLVEIKSKKLGADEIMEKASSRRKIHQNKMDSLILLTHVKLYLKQENNVDEDSVSSILISRESRIYQNQEQFKEVILYEKEWSEKATESRFSANKGGPFANNNRYWQATNPAIYGLNREENNFDFYNPWIKISTLSEAPLISPLNTLANLYYNFDIDSTFLGSDSSLMYKIRISPKSENAQTFSGIIEVQGGTWKIVRVELSLEKLKYFSKFSISQDYITSSNDENVLNKQIITYQLKRDGKNLKGQVEQGFTNYQFSLPAKFNFRNEVRMDSSFFFPDSFKTKPFPQILNFQNDEIKYIQKVDSLEQFWQSEAYQKQLDSIANKLTLGDIFLRGIDRYNHQKGYKFLIDPILQQARIFGVGGYRHSLGTKFIKNYSKGHELSLYGQADYGFNNHDIRGSGEVNYIYWPNKFAYLKIGVGSKYQMLTFIQNFASLFARNNFVLNDYFEIGHGIEILNGIYVDVNAKYMLRSSIANMELSTWEKDLFGENNSPVAFDDYQELNLKLKLEYTPYQRYETKKNRKKIIGSKWPTLVLYAEQGIPNFFESSVHYLKTEVGLNQSLKWPILGNGKYAVRYGRFVYTNEVYYPNYHFYRGTDNYLFANPINSFQLLGPTLSTFNDYLDAHYIHHFGDFFTRRIPVVRKAKFETVAGAGILWLKDSSFKHSEWLVGLEWPFKLSGNRFKLGVYYVAATSTYSNLNNQIKVGLNFYNNFTREWFY